MVRKRGVPGRCASADADPDARDPASDRSKLWALKIEMRYHAGQGWADFQVCDVLAPAALRLWPGVEFHRTTCMLAVHYFLDSQEALRTFLHLAARIRPNGVLALTTLSSDVILDRRGIGENGSGRGRGELHEHGALVHRRLYWIWIDAETVKRASQNPDQFGLGYDFRWADGLRSEEYLVNSRLLKEKCQRPGLRLRVARSFKDWLQDKMACPSPKNQYRAIGHTFPEDDKKAMELSRTYVFEGDESYGRSSESSLPSLALYKLWA